MMIIITIIGSENILSVQRKSVLNITSELLIVIFGSCMISALEMSKAQGQFMKKKSIFTLLCKT
jgi:hypothetical protein